MVIHNKTAEWFVPDGVNLEKAVARTSHLAISAHQDDIEIMAHDGILKCFGRDDRWFTGVVVTNGAGSPRDDLYAKYTDEQMQTVRRVEQKKAAYVGEYSALALLDYESAVVKDTENPFVVEGIAAIIKAAKPETVYTHNLADKHDTHVSVALRVISAVRGLSETERPKKLYGCEVWRGLDWMQDSSKVKFDVSGRPNIGSALISVFDSQICGGKRYDKATEGRRTANATYSESHGIDTAEAVIYAMDLTPLINDCSKDIADYVIGYINEFSYDVRSKISKFGQ